jgi:hypothetical protein
MTVDPGDQRQKRSLIGAGLTIVRYALVATKFRTAAKLRDGSLSDSCIAANRAL